MLNLEQLDTLQALEYDALECFAQYCRGQGLSFFLRGGSALGAVKYGGIIPWDDDIDVVLPRQDYNRFLASVPRQLGDFLVICCQRDPEAHCYFPRMVLPESRGKELGLPCNHGAGTLLMDILPLDGVPERRSAFAVHDLQIKWYRLLSSVWTLGAANVPCKRTGIRKWIPEIMRKLGIHRLYSQTDVFRQMDRLYEQYPYGAVKYAGVLAGSKGAAEVMPVRWWGRGRNMKFGSGEYPVPERWDRYLKRLFGENYMTEEPDRSVIDERSHFA